MPKSAFARKLFIRNLPNKPSQSNILEPARYLHLANFSFIFIIVWLNWHRDTNCTKSDIRRL